MCESSATVERHDPCHAAVVCRLASLPLVMRLAWPLSIIRDRGDAAPRFVLLLSADVCAGQLCKQRL